MSFANYETITGPLSKASIEMENIGLTIKYGINCDLKFTVEGNGIEKGKRKGAFFSNEVTMFGKIKTEIVKDISVLDGINNSMVDENGLFSGEKLVAAFSDNYDIDNRLAVNMAQDIMGHKDDNTVFLLYNMLRLYFHKKLVETGIKLKINPDDTIYDDGHIAIDLKTAFDLKETKDVSDWKPFSVNKINFMRISDSSRLPKSFKGCFLNLDKMLPNEIHVIELAAGEFDSSFDFIRILHPSPKVCNSIVALDESNPAITQPHDNYLDMSSSTIYNSIMELIKNNRLQAHFDMAYAIFSQVLFQHKPRSAEAIYWLKKSPTIKLCESKTIRGMHRHLTAGTSLVTDVARWTTFNNFMKQPMRAIVHSIALSEAVNVSAFEYYTARADSNFKDMLDSYVGSTHCDNTGLMRDMQLVSLRFKTKQYMPWASIMGLCKFEWLCDRIIPSSIVKIILNDLKAVETYDIITRYKESGEIDSYYLKLTELVCYCYPVLSMGINVSNYYMNDLNLSVEIDYDKEDKCFVEQDISKVNKMMALMRVMGWDMIATTVPDNKNYANWAPNTNGHYVPNLIRKLKRTEFVKISKGQFVKRSNCWIDLPNFSDKIRIEMTGEVKRFSIKIDGKEAEVNGTLVMMQSFDRETSTIKIIGRDVNYTPLTIDIEDIIILYQDFRKLSQINQLVAQTDLIGV